MLENYKGLKVWQESHELCLKIYRVTGKFPQEALIKIVGKQTHDPSNPWTLFITYLEKNQILK